MLFNLKKIEYKVGTHNVLKECNISIKENEHLLILGPSGCGKTTLINLMAGLLKTTSGEIFFEKQSYSLMQEKEIDDLRANNFGFIFQKLHLIEHLNVQQNIAIANTKFNFKRNEELINNLGLTEKKNQKIHDLSVGEAQRVAIARGLVNKPKVIFADEPTSALDDVNAKKVMDLIFSQMEKTSTTLIVSTHDDRIKKNFSQILEIKV